MQSTKAPWVSTEEWLASFRAQSEESREHLLGAEIEARLALNCAMSEKRGFAILNALEAAVQALRTASAELNRDD